MTIILLQKYYCNNKIKTKGKNITYLIARYFKKFF